MRFRLSSSLSFIVVFVAACGELSIPTESLGRPPVFQIADAASNYKRGFYWLPPVVTSSAYAGTFDAGLSPTVEICELIGDMCGLVVGTFTPTSGTGGELVRLSLEDEHYKVNWHTNEFALSTDKLYRISVRAGISNTLLGFADVQVTNNGSGLKNVDTDEFIGLVDGRTLPIMFRIETGTVGSVRVEPVEAEASPGEQQQFVAIVSDLHGTQLSAVVAWASSNEDVATIDQTGLATAVGDGVATISATSERVSGQATLTVEAGQVVVTAGTSTTCAIDIDGGAFCWGLGTSGQLGNGSVVPSFATSPVAVLGGITFSTIATSLAHTCAIATSGAGYCWGSAVNGRLGNGSMTGIQLTPAPVLGDLTFASITIGVLSTCAITTGGVGYCWGAGANGRLGNGTFVSQSTPTPVIGGHTFSSVSTAFGHTCAVTTGNEAYCWGDNFDRQLGIAPGSVGPNGDLNFPTPMLVLGDLSFTEIAVGFGHSCGITTAGAAYCWGSNSEGQLGVGPPLTSRSAPTAVLGGLTLSSIAAHTRHTCAITTAGQAYCWGLGLNGRLGNGSTASQSTPVLVAGGLTFASISVGAEHTCAVATDGQPYCWGSGALGKLGRGSVVGSTTPVPVNSFP